MNRAFEKHAAYLDQAWRTLQDSVILKTSPAQRRKRLRRGRTQGAVPLEKPSTQEPSPPMSLPYMDGDFGAKRKPLSGPSGKVEVRPPRGPRGPTHMSNVAPLSEKEKAAQRKMRAKMSERAERALMQSKIQELSGGGTEEQPGDDSMVSTVPRPPQDWWDTFATDIDPGQ